jgi:hypothetical protein
VSLVVAFDESLRGSYLGVGAAYDGSQGRRVDQFVRSQRAPGQVRFHARNESDARRHAFLKGCVELGGVSLWIYQAHGTTMAVRRAIVGALTSDAVQRRIGRLVIEQGDPGRDRADRSEIQRVLRAIEVDHDFPYSHERPGSHCGLEIADVGAWAFGAGGEWSERVRPLVAFAKSVPVPATKS